MRPYRFTVNLKLGLILFAILLAVASLWYTNYLVDRLRTREQAIIELWADAQQQQIREAQAQIVASQYRQRLDDLHAYLEQAPLPDETQRSYLTAVEWAQGMPPSGESVINKILTSRPFLSIPAIITDSATQQPTLWRQVGVPSPDSLRALSGRDSARAVRRLESVLADMDATYEPITIELTYPWPENAGIGRLVQYVHYDESGLIKELRIYPFVQLLFVGLFVLIGYVGFSYVRRSEQSNLWVGMAREAAHQLGTPISSLMGWTSYLRLQGDERDKREEAVEEIEKDTDRLRRVAERFSDIGSMPKMKAQALAPLVYDTVDYIRRRMSQSRQVRLQVDIPEDRYAAVNAELFEWVIENLMKNALDAMEGSEGHINIEARQAGAHIEIDLADTGKGIDRRHWKNVFRPGYCTKKRGWGLGLSLSKRIVEEYHGGTLALLRSRVGEGTTFRLQLPAAEPGA